MTGTTLRTLDATWVKIAVEGQRVHLNLQEGGPVYVVYGPTPQPGEENAWRLTGIGNGINLKIASLDLFARSPKGAVICTIEEGSS